MIKCDCSGELLADLYENDKGARNMTGYTHQRFSAKTSVFVVFDFE